MSDPDPDEVILPHAAAMLGLDLPDECLPGVRDALNALDAHWRLLDDE